MLYVKSNIDLSGNLEMQEQLSPLIHTLKISTNNTIFYYKLATYETIN